MSRYIKQAHRRLRAGGPRNASGTVFPLKQSAALCQAVVFCLCGPLPAARAWAAPAEVVRAATVQTANDRTTQPDELTQPMRGEVANALVWKDRKSGLVRRVEGHVRFPKAQTEAGAAREFLRRYGRLLTGASLLTKFSPNRTVKTLTGTHFVFTRFLNGLRVFDDQIIIHVDYNRVVTLVTSDLKIMTAEGRRPSARELPRVASRNAALAAVRRAEPTSAPASAEEGFYVNDRGVPLLAWKVVVMNGTSSAREFIVDGVTYELVSVKVLATYPR